MIGKEGAEIEIAALRWFLGWLVSLDRITSSLYLMAKFPYVEICTLRKWSESQAAILTIVIQAVALITEKLQSRCLGAIMSHQLFQLPLYGRIHEVVKAVLLRVT